MSPVDANGQTVGPSPAGLVHDNANWWAHRKPQNDEERDQWIGLSFEPSIVMEGRLVVRERHPSIHQMLAIDERARVDDYARRRAARLRRGPAVALPTMDVDRIDRAAMLLRSAGDLHGSDVGVVSDRGRDAFRAAIVERRPFDEVMQAWRRWLDELGAIRTRLNRIGKARGELGLPGSGFIIHPPTFLDELGAAMDALGHIVFADADLSARKHEQ